MHTIFPGELKVNTPDRIKPLLALLITSLVLAACRSSPVESPDSQPQAEGGETEFVNENVTLENPLATPPLLEPSIENGEKVFNLTVEQGQAEILPGMHTQTWGYNGALLGPTIRARTGDRVRLNVTNLLGETTTVHWHGMELPAAMDGGPHQIIAPGQTWQAHWTISNEAATLWYHPHVMDRTGEQVYRGLAGFFILDDENSDSLALPREYGVDDIPLVVQDKRFDPSGQFVYSHTREAITAGLLGDTILVNGTYAPTLEVPAKLIRLRLLNGSVARRFNFGFSDNRAFHQIATDGGMLAAPVERTRLLLAPGERAEILVDFSQTMQPVTLLSYAFVDSANAIQNRVQEQLTGGTDEGQQFKLLELRPRPGSHTPAAMPNTLNTLDRFDDSAAVNTRRFVLGAFTINSQRMDHRRVDEIVRAGDTEIWEFKNESPIYHPMHIHGVQFRVLDRNGMEPPAYEQGWKDTVHVSPEETVRVTVRFPAYADPHLPYMFHCHILTHEDMGMMGQFVLVEDPAAPVQIQSPLTEGTDGEHRGHSN